jgi:hypothetical protein
MTRNTRIQTLFAFAMILFVSMVHGTENSSVEYSGSGFFTTAAGKMLGGTQANVNDYNCPCYISDYAQAGVYVNSSGLQWKPDSKLGLQGSATYGDLSVTAQVVARGATGTANLEWLYGNYNLNNKISIQVGRKRLPMFFYSDVQDIGIALPWAHLPPGPYGWEAVNFNGINVRYQDRWGDWSTTTNLLAGNETNDNSGYWKLYNGRLSKSKIKWSNIVGGDLSIAKDWLETRVVYIQSNTQEDLVGNGWNGSSYTNPPAVIFPTAKQQIFGLTLNADFLNWLVRTEFNQINHPGLNYKDHAQLVGVGYRYGKWQPMATWSEYRGTLITSGVLPNVNANTPFTPNMQQTLSLTLRYDFTPTSDLKVQFDSQTDHSDPGYLTNFGNSRLLTFTYDTLF